MVCNSDGRSLNLLVSERKEMDGAAQCTDEQHYSQFPVRVICKHQMFGRYVWLVAEDLMVSELILYGYGESPPPPCFHYWSTGYGESLSRGQPFPHYCSNR